MVDTPRMSKWIPESDQMILRRVGKTGEECAELSKVCSRITIQGLDGVDPATGEANRAALAKEIADVVAQCYTTISALGLDDDAIRVRCIEKQRQMAEWEAMFQPQEPGAPWSPRLGDLVRYGDGSTALALHGEPHAGGWHGTQCMGGYTFYTRVYPPTEQDRKQWVESAVRWRKVPLQQAMAEAGIGTNERLAAECTKLREELATERQAAFEAVNRFIKPGPLQGNGWDEQAQRNGLTLAANILAARRGPT